MFDGQCYDQVDGVAMGSTLGPVLAIIFMCHFEEKWVFKGGFKNSERGGSRSPPPPPHE